MYWAPIMFSELGWALGYKKMGFLLSGSFLLEFSTYSSQDHYAALPKDNVLLIFGSSLLGRGISWHGLLFWPFFQGPEAMHVSISLSPQRMRPEGSSQPLFHLTHREATQKSPPRMLGSWWATLNKWKKSSFHTWRGWRCLSWGLDYSQVNKYVPGYLVTSLGIIEQVSHRERICKSNNIRPSLHKGDNSALPNGFESIQTQLAMRETLGSQPVAACMRVHSCMYLCSASCEGRDSLGWLDDFFFFLFLFSGV